MAFPTSGKWYWEVTLNNTPYLYQVGIYSYNRPLSGSISGTGNEYQVAFGTAYTYIQYQSNNAAFAAWGTNTNPTSGDVLMLAFDADNSTMWFGRNGTWYNTSGTANPATNTDPRFSSIPSGLFAGVNMPNPASGGVAINFGQRPFSYTPPTGFKRLNTYNLPTPTIPNGAAQFAATLYTGTGAALSVANTVNGVSFQPDFVWLKGRSVAYNNYLYNSVRGALKELYSDSTSAEVTATQTMTSFNSGGFSVGTDNGVNQSAATYVGWQWKANGTPATINTIGTIPSTISVNPTAGFSIVTYTGNGTGALASAGHGLGVTPKMIIVKNRGSATNWPVYHASLPSAAYYLLLNTTAAFATDVGYWGNTAPDAAQFYIYGTSGSYTNISGANYVAYCFAEIAGFSKFGGWTGNGAADGPFIYTGFRPRFILIKDYGNPATNWIIQDTARSTYNTSTTTLSPNSIAAEATYSSPNGVDFLSNGFKVRVAGAPINTSGNGILYAAFAENPFNYSLAR
jgi:hypothetical protein